MRPGRRRSRFWRHAARTLAASGVAIGLVAIVGDWIGFGWASGLAAIGAVGALLLSFALSSDLPAAKEGDDWTNVPNVSVNTDSE